jgi:ankyrin repeat protein
VSDDPKSTPHPLPTRPSLSHLKSQANDLIKAGAQKTVAAAQFQIARLYGFASWSKLRAHVASVTEVGQLKDAIDREDFDRVKTMMLRNPALHRAPMGYANDGPLTWIAECRVPSGPPSPKRLEIARWMIEHGSDVHQGGDGPLMRAAVQERLAMMELLVGHGADVNAEWHGEYPIIYAACETVDPVTLTWLLDHGANPNCDNLEKAYPDTALDYVIGSYVRSPELRACIDILVQAGCRTKCLPPVLDVLRADTERLSQRLDGNPALVRERCATLDFGTTGGRMLTLRGATLLHVATEYRNMDAMVVLLKRGADPNARSAVSESGIGGQTPLFHAVTQREDGGLPAVRLLLDHGADVTVRAKVPGHYERLDEVLECTALGYARAFVDEPCRGDKTRTVAFLVERGATE